MRVPMVMRLSAAALLAACGGSSGPTGPSGPPAITVVNGATLPSGTIGATVVIEGRNFGTSQSVASGHVIFSTTAGGRDTAAITSAADWTNLLIVTTVPAGVPVGRDTLFVETSGGTSAPFVFTVVTKVAFSPSTVSWTATTALPVGLSGHAVAAATLPGITSTSVVYVVGGATGWAAPTSLPAAVHSLGAVIFNGTVYVAGGSGSGNAPVATVYRAVIQSDGMLGNWQALPSLPFARSYFGFGINGTSLYALGGDSGTVTPNDSSLSAKAISDVIYAEIDVHTGNLSAAGWTANGTKLKKVVSKQTAVVAGGDVLVTAGLYNGDATGATEESYAGLNSDGSTTAFNGATGSNTISSAGGGNLFNHAATGYLDATGAFHVLVVGGDDVNTPTKKHKGVFYY